MARRKTTVAASVACGVLCAACVVAFMQGVRGEAEAARAEALARYGGEQLEVCVATRDLPAGQAIAAGDVELKMWVADLLPSDAAQTIEEVEGRVPSTPIMEGEVVVLKRFEGSNVTLDVPEGLAALSVPAKDVQAVGGSLAAGETADLYAVGGTSTVLLARDVLVLATSSAGSEGAQTELSWVTVAIAPESVQEIIDASQKSELYFVLPSAESADESAAEVPASTDAATRDKPTDEASQDQPAGGESSEQPSVGGSAERSSDEGGAR